MLSRVEMLEQTLEKLLDKMGYLSDKIIDVDNFVKYNITLHWTIILGVVVILLTALGFLTKSMVERGIEKGIAKKLEENKSKADKKNPELIGTIKLNSVEDDLKNVRIVKLDNEPTINIQTDKDNAKLQVNNKNVLFGDEICNSDLELVNGWTIDKDKNEYAIVSKTSNIVTVNLFIHGGLISEGTTICWLPSGCNPKKEIITSFISESGNNVGHVKIRKCGDIIIGNMKYTKESFYLNVVYTVVDTQD